MGKLAPLFSLLFMLNSAEVAAQLRLTGKPNSMANGLSMKVVPQNFYSQHLGFACKAEVKLQKLTTLAIFIRAGSKEYVDYLEKKPHSYYSGPRH